MALLALAGLFGLIWSSPAATHQVSTSWQVNLTHRHALVSLGLLIGLLITLPLIAIWFINPTLAMIDHLFRTGALVFGGGHVVLPLLYDGFHQLGVNDDIFLAGYGVTQAMPGPLLSFAAFLGAVLPQTFLPIWLINAIRSLATGIMGNQCRCGRFITGCPIESNCVTRLTHSMGYALVSISLGLINRLSLAVMGLCLALCLSSYVA
jgi:hypothetical protein